MFRTVPGLLSAILYPRACAVCGDSIDRVSAGPACSKCWAAARFFTGLETLCSKCGAFLSPAEPLYETFCRRCDDAHFDLARAAGAYEGALAAAVLDLKTKPFIPPQLRRQMELAFRDHFEGKFDLIVPVPLSRHRLRERGFNQAAVIARLLAKQSGGRLDEASLIRTRHTRLHRVAMDQKARELSVKNAFEVRRPRLIDGKHILLVDDVMTSGATASQCSRTLKKAGAASVNAITLARAVLHIERA